MRAWLHGRAIGEGCPSRACMEYSFASFQTHRELLRYRLQWGSLLAQNHLHVRQAHAAYQPRLLADKHSRVHLCRVHAVQSYPLDCFLKPPRGRQLIARVRASRTYSDQQGSNIRGPSFRILLWSWSEAEARTSLGPRTALIRRSPTPTCTSPPSYLLPPPLTYS